MGVRTYDADRVVVIFAGNPIGGFADGTFVKAERTEDTFKTTVGAGGEVCRSRMRNKAATITLTLLASAPSNDVLSAIAQLDELTGNGVGPFFLKDLNGTMVCAAQNAWIQKMPAVEQGKEIGTREWVLGCDALEEFVGGNNVSLP